jgi:hypothetical protein
LRVQLQVVKYPELATDGFDADAGPDPNTEKTFSIMRQKTDVTPGTAGGTRFG